MRIDETNFPMLFGKHGDFGQNNVIPFNEFLNWPATTKEALENCYFITKPVREGVYQSFRKIVHLRNELTECARCVCSIINTGTDKLYVSMSYAITKRENFISIAVLESITDGKSGYVRNNHCSIWFDTKDNNHEQVYYYDKSPDNQLAFYAMAVELFLKFADIDVKNLPTNRQIFEGVNCLYNNKSKYPIKIVDSTWFTTLVKSDAFKVRGHFRLQACGEGMTKRKLVWINDFQKEGYTRQAKKLSEVDSE